MTYTELQVEARRLIDERKSIYGSQKKKDNLEAQSLCQDLLKNSENLKREQIGEISTNFDESEFFLIDVDREIVLINQQLKQIKILMRQKIGAVSARVLSSVNSKAPETETLWLSSLKGKHGDPGTPGKDGKSAYQVAVSIGYSGSEAQWLAQLKGKDGDPGTPGKDGNNGKSAFEIARANGFSGSEAEWVDSLKGKHGDPGTPGQNGNNGKSAFEIARANGFSGSEDEWLNYLKGKNGAPGVPPEDYKQVKSELSDARDQISSLHAEMRNLCESIITLTTIPDDGDDINLELAQLAAKRFAAKAAQPNAEPDDSGANLRIIKTNFEKVISRAEVVSIKEGNSP